MKLLITGGCGFLGSNLASDALARGDELVVDIGDARHMGQPGARDPINSVG